MKKIKLTQGKFAIVDDDMFDELSKHKWHFSNGYAKRGDYSGFNRKMLLMHRVIMNTPDGMDTDHIDHNGLNNQRNNLRVCGRNENLRNRLIGRNNRSGMKGVYWDKQHNKWRVQVYVNRIRAFDGFFNTLIEAATAYDLNARNIHGEFAKTNF